jgi:voltage-gated potassium channel
MNKEKLSSATYELFITTLSILSVFNIVLALIAKDAEVNSVLTIINLLLSVIFLIDFSFRLFTAESKYTYFFKEFGWADLLGSLPFEQLKILRLFRVWRAGRILKKYGLRNMLREINNNRARSALLMVFLLIIILLEFGSMGMVIAERNDPNANITTGGDAIWWAYVTITTVGYGDQYPVTQAGRFIGMLVMTTGVGLFGILTGYLANNFVSPQSATTQEPDKPANSVVTTKELKKQITFHNREITKLKTQLQKSRKSSLRK